MLTSLEIFKAPVTEDSVPIHFPFIGDPVGEASVQSLVIRGIDGIGPAKATITTAQIGSFDGENYVGSNTGKRNIILKIGLNPDWADQSMAGLRQQLYRYLMPKRKVKLRFTSAYLPVVEIDGYVEDFEPNIFSQDPEMVVSIICPRSEFVAVESTVIEGFVVEDGSYDRVTIEYPGTVETGIELKVFANVEVPTYSDALRIIFDNEDDPEKIFQLYEFTIPPTRYFHLNSTPGSKFVRDVLISSLTYTSLLWRVREDSPDWPVLKPGTNQFAVTTGGDDEPGQSWELTYFAKFGGL